MDFQGSQDNSDKTAISLTIFNIIGVRWQAQSCRTVFTLEATAVEELAFSTQPLHHVDSLVAKVTDITASQVLGELLFEWALDRNKHG